MPRKKNTQPAQLVRSYLYSKGFRYKKNVSTLPGNPDIVLPMYKSIVFVYNCSWHQHDRCENATKPKKRTDWWISKLNSIIAEDAENIRKLKMLGWHVSVIWECEIENHLENTVEALIKELVSKR